MTANLDQLEIILSKFGFRHFRTIFFSDDTIKIEFKSHYVEQSDLHKLCVLGFSIKSYSGCYVIVVKFANHD